MSEIINLKGHHATHYTTKIPYIKDSGLDPFASPEHPFQGDFVVTGSISAINVSIGQNVKVEASYTTVNTNSAGWESTETIVNNNKTKWDSVYTNVNGNSGAWESTETTLNTLSAGWSSTQTTVNTNSAIWGSAYTTVNTNSAGWESTKTTLNTLSAGWESTHTIVNTNSASWGADGISGKLLPEFDARYVNVTGDTITGNLTIQQMVDVWGDVLIRGNSTVLGSAMFLDTEHFLLANNQITLNANVTGSIEPVLDAGITVSRGLCADAQFFWNETTHIWTAGVSGNNGLSAIAYQDDVNIIRNQSNGIQTTVQNNSANWNYQGTDIKSLSAGWSSTQTTVNTNSADWVSNQTTVANNSALWTGGNSAYTTVNNNSAGWSSTQTTVNTNSGDWNSTYTQLNSLSSKWESVYTTVNTTSSLWTSGSTFSFEAVNHDTGNTMVIYVIDGKIIATYE